MEVLRSWALPLTLLLLPVASCREVTGVSFAEAENNGFARGVDNLPLDQACAFTYLSKFARNHPSLRAVTVTQGRAKRLCLGFHLLILRKTSAKRASLPILPPFSAAFSSFPAGMGLPGFAPNFSRRAPLFLEVAAAIQFVAFFAIFVVGLLFLTPATLAGKCTHGRQPLGARKSCPIEAG